MSKPRSVILLTGATGFAGNHVLRELMPEFDPVLLKRSTSNTSRIADLLPGMRSFNVDQSDVEEVVRSIPEAEGVIHLATCYTTRAGSAEDLYRANVDFPLSILRALRGTSGNFFINADTFYPAERDDYGRTKAAFREEAAALASKGGLRFINARLEHVYGPADSAQKFIPSVVRRCLENVPEIQFSAGTQTRDFVHVRDAAKAFALLARRACEGALAAGSFQIGTGEQLSIRALVEKIKDLTASQTRLMWEALPTLPGEVMSSAADNHQLVELGWNPQVSLESGLRELVEEIRQALHRS